MLRSRRSTRRRSFRPHICDLSTGSAPHGVGPVGYDGAMTNPCPTTAWSLAPADPAAIERLTTGLNISRVTASVLASRGIATAEDARAFFEPSLSRDWLAPSVIPGMDEAADRVAAAVREGESILVFGDFDLDGVSATAVATRGLRALGARVTPFVPHRFREGYGLSAAAIDRALAAKPDLIVTVDCGVSAAEEVEALRARGVDVVITDHHEPSDLLPVGVPVANPKLVPDGLSRDLAGAGVALKLVQAVGARVGRPDVWLDFADLATLGTVADIVPLTGENRALVTAGLSAIRRSPRVGLAALCAVAGVTTDNVSSDTIAFSLSPRLNAAGRMADPAIALELLLADDPAAAETLAQTLDEHNRTRQAVEADLAQAALALAGRVYSGERALVLAGEGWHEGVKGIVASRLAQTYHVPALLFSVEEGVAKGSGRSVGSVDLFAAVSAASGTLERFGGHEAAVGLALPADRLEQFRAELLAYLDTLPAEQFSASLGVDAEISLEEASIELGAELELLEPYGAANPKPMLVVRDVFMNGRERVGKTGTHLRFTAFDGAASVGAIAFRCPDIDATALHEGAVDLAFSLEVDEWRGRRRAQLV
ncbi:MAG: single-stranded-DNA-specific exonuclease RecJ, partial [Actinobacteria bacterium]